MKIIRIILPFIVVLCALAGTTHVNVNIDIDSYRFLVNPAINSTNGRCPFGAIDSIEASTSYWDGLDNYEKYRDYHFGQMLWDYESDVDSLNQPSELVKILGKESFGQGGYLRYNLHPSGNLRDICQSDNWKTIVGPFDEDSAVCRTLREAAGDSCGIELPSYRYGAFGIPEMVEVAEEMGLMPMLVYLRVIDSLYEVDDSFSYIDTCYWRDTIWVCDTVPSIHNSLPYDAYCFAQYLFGNPATDTTGWAKLRQDIDGIDPVNTDLIMLGNDVGNKYSLRLCTGDSLI